MLERFRGAALAGVILFLGCGPVNDDRDLSGRLADARRAEQTMPEAMASYWEQAPIIPAALARFSPDAKPHEPLGIDEMSILGITKGGQITDLMSVLIATAQPYQVEQAKALRVATIGTRGLQIPSKGALTQPYDWAFPQAKTGVEARGTSVISATFPRLFEGQDLLEWLRDFGFTMYTYTISEGKPDPASFQRFQFTTPKAFHFLPHAAE